METNRIFDFMSAEAFYLKTVNNLVEDICVSAGLHVHGRNSITLRPGESCMKPIEKLEALTLLNEGMEYELIKNGRISIAFLKTIK